MFNLLPCELQLIIFEYNRPYNNIKNHHKKKYHDVVNEINDLNKFYILRPSQILLGYKYSQLVNINMTQPDWLFNYRPKKHNFHNFKKYHFIIKKIK